MTVELREMFRARKLVYQYLRPTSLIEHPLLSAHLGCRSHVKHENHNPTGSFKIRGGLNLIHNLSPDERRRGVVTATRGNHGQSIALACQIYGVRCVVAVPEGNNPEKNEAMKAFGAELIIHGRDFDEAREKVKEIQQKEGLRYIHSANEPALIHGVGTYALEILEDLENPDYVLVPLGGGSGISATVTAMRSLSPATKVIGVQAEQAPSIYLSWKKGEIVTTDSADTMADGLATRIPFEMTFSIIQKHVDEIVTVSEEELEEAVFQLYRTTHNVAEGAGAASTAAAYKLRKKLSGKKVVLILSGSNIEAQLFEQILLKYGVTA
jgi:threonine dehydratase